MYVAISLSLTPPQQDLEGLVKASFVQKFARYTDWPHREIDTSFRIAIYGSQEIKNLYNDVYHSRKIKDLPVKIDAVNTNSNISDYHILILPHTHRNKIEEIAKMLEGNETLIICESKGMANRGAHINFIKTHNETLHFEINESRVKKSGLQMNLLLLDIAILIQD